MCTGLQRTQLQCVMPGAPTCSDRLGSCQRLYLDVSAGILTGAVPLQRRQQGAAFTPDAMDAYLPRVVATCEAYLQHWASQDSVNLVPAVRLPCLQDTHPTELHPAHIIVLYVQEVRVSRRRPVSMP